MGLYIWNKGLIKNSYGQIAVEKYRPVETKKAFNINTKYFVFFNAIHPRKLSGSRFVCHSLCILDPVPATRINSRHSVESVN